VIRRRFARGLWNVEHVCRSIVTDWVWRDGEIVLVEPAPIAAEAAAAEGAAAAGEPTAGPA